MYNPYKSMLLVMLCLLSIKTNAQTIALTTIANITSTLEESSGITCIAPNKLYTHNDSGGNDEIYELDSLGNLTRTISINNSSNSDWEDITHDDANNIYIGDFGNNINDRTNLRIYKIASPLTFSGNSTNASLIEFNYPDQTLFPPAPQKRNFDAEAFVWYNDSLYIFTKNRTAPFNGYCKLYKIPASPGSYTATLCDSVLFCNTSQTDCWVTSAALSPDKTHLALLNGSKIFWFSCFNGAQFFDGALATITLNTNTQKEGITFKNNHEVYITDEYVTIVNNGGNLYQTDLTNYIEMPYVGINQDSIVCNNCTLNVDSFVGNLTWSNGATGPTLLPGNTGWYAVTASTLNNCSAVDSIYVTNINGMNTAHANQLSLQCQTANANGIAGIISGAEGENCLLQLMDISGRLIKTIAIPYKQNKQAFVIAADLSNGIYLLQLSSIQSNKTYKIAITN